MTENIHIFGTLSAVALQMYAIILAQPFRRMLARSTWQIFMALNLCILGRRVLSVVGIIFDWRGAPYENLAVLVGLFVSIFILMAVVSLRRYIVVERKRTVDLAKATLDLALKTKQQDSVAYQLALHLVDLREIREEEHEIREEEHEIREEEHRVRSDEHKVRDQEHVVRDQEHKVREHEHAVRDQEHRDQPGPGTGP